MDVWLLAADGGWNATGASLETKSLKRANPAKAGDAKSTVYRATAPGRQDCQSEPPAARPSAVGSLTAAACHRVLCAFGVHRRSVLPGWMPAATHWKLHREQRRSATTRSQSPPRQRLQAGTTATRGCTGSLPAAGRGWSDMGRLRAGASGTRLGQRASARDAARRPVRL